MGKEIERKFRVSTNNAFRTSMIMLANVPNTGYYQEMIHQGYFSTEKEAALRVRVSFSGERGAKGFVTVKGQGMMEKDEWEMEIDQKVACELLKKCSQVIIKHRHHVGRWEVDEFVNVRDPDKPEQLLILAEIELHAVDEPVVKPLWLGEEVTEDHRYYNANLVQYVQNGGEK